MQATDLSGAELQHEVRSFQRRAWVVHCVLPRLSVFHRTRAPVAPCVAPCNPKTAATAAHLEELTVSPSYPPPPTPHPPTFPPPAGQVEPPLDGLPEGRLQEPAEEAGPGLYREEGGARPDPGGAAAHQAGGGARGAAGAGGGEAPARGEDRGRRRLGAAGAPHNVVVGVYRASVLGACAQVRHGMCGLHPRGGGAPWEKSRGAVCTRKTPGGDHTVRGHTRLLKLLSSYGMEQEKRSTGRGEGTPWAHAVVSGDHKEGETMMHSGEWQRALALYSYRDVGPHSSLSHTILSHTIR